MKCLVIQKLFLLIYFNHLHIKLYYKNRNFSLTLYFKKKIVHSYIELIRIETPNYSQIQMKKVSSKKEKKVTSYSYESKIIPIEDIDMLKKYFYEKEDGELGKI